MAKAEAVLTAALVLLTTFVATNATNTTNARSPRGLFTNGAKIVSGLIGAVKTGSSVVETISSFQSMDYKVKNMVEIENLSDQPLHLVRSEVHSGYVNIPPPPAILPGKDPLYTKLPLMNCSTSTLQI